MRLLVSALLMALLGIPVALAWNEPTGFRNIPWGTSPEIVRQHFPDFRWEREGGPTYVLHRARGSLMIGSIRVFTVIEFETGGMDTVMLSFASEKYDDMKITFLERYGPPSQTETQPVQNRMGASFLNESLTWTGQVVTIRLDKYGSKITDSFAQLITHEASALSQQRRTEQGKARKKDL